MPKLYTPGGLGKNRDREVAPARTAVSNQIGIGNELPYYKQEGNDFIFHRFNLTDSLI